MGLLAFKLVPCNFLEKMAILLKTVEKLLKYQFCYFEKDALKLSWTAMMKHE